MTPAVILFDLGGVLLPVDQRRRLRAVAGALGISEAEARVALDAHLFAQLDVGQVDEQAFADSFAAAAGRAVTRAEARALILSVFEAPDDETWAIAQHLREQAIVGGFSDNPPFVREVFPAGADLDPMFWSAELGATKATEAAFAMVEARLGAEPDAILFVDDSEANVAIARRRGWQAHRFSGSSALRADLAERGLI